MFLTVFEAWEVKDPSVSVFLSYHAVTEGKGVQASKTTPGSYSSLLL